MGIFVSLFLSVLAGVGVDRLARRFSTAGGAVLVAGICTLVLLEVSPKPFPLTPIEGRPVDTWLAAQNDSGVVVQLPADELGRPQDTFYTMFHRHPFVGAFFSRVLSAQYRRIEPSLRTFLSGSSIDTLKRLGVRWVLVDLARYGSDSAVREESVRLGLQPMAELDGELVLRMP